MKSIYQLKSKLSFQDHLKKSNNHIKYSCKTEFTVIIQNYDEEQNCNSQGCKNVLNFLTPDIAFLNLVNAFLQ